VQGGVELAVAASVQSMPADIAAGGLHRGGAGVAGEVVAAGEAGDVAGVAEQLGGQHRADPVQLGQGGAVLADRSADGLAGGLDLAVQAAHVGQQLVGDPLALGVDGRDRVGLAEQGSGSGGRELPGGAAGLQVSQQHMQAAQGAGALGDQVVAAVAEQPEDHRLVLPGDRAQPPVVDGGRSDRAGIGQVALAGAAGPQQSGPGGQLGRHIHDRLPGSDQQLGDPAAQATGALDRPAPLRPLLGPGQQLDRGLVGGRQPQLAEEAAMGVQGGGSQGALMGVDADGDHGVAFRRGGHGFRDGQPDFRWAHASVEPRHGGCRPHPGTLSASQPHRAARSLRARRPAPWTLRAADPGVLAAIQQVRSLA
jgi:hypothetical protein